MPSKRAKGTRTRSIERDVRLAAKPSAVWKLLATARGLERWFGMSVKLEPRAGGRFDVDYVCGADLRGSVVAIEPKRRLVLDWDRDKNRLTRVELTLEPERGGPTPATLLRVRHTGFRAGRVWGQWYRYQDEGWDDSLAALSDALDKT